MRLFHSMMSLIVAGFAFMLVFKTHLTISKIVIPVEDIVNIKPVEKQEQVNLLCSQIACSSDNDCIKNIDAKRGNCPASKICLNVF